MSVRAMRWFVGATISFILLAVRVHVLKFLGLAQNRSAIKIYFIAAIAIIAVSGLVFGLLALSKRSSRGISFPDQLLGEAAIHFFVAAIAAYYCGKLFMTI